MFGLPTIPQLTIYFNYHRLMKLVANFRNLMIKFIAKTHLYRYQIISSIAFSNVLAISVALTLTAVPLAVLSLIASVPINVQTVLVGIIFLIPVLNCYDGYTNLIHHIISSSPLEKCCQKLDYLMSTTAFQSKKINCYQEAGVICSFFIHICYLSFFLRYLL